MNWRHCGRKREKGLVEEVTVETSSGGRDSGGEDEREQEENAGKGGHYGSLKAVERRTQTETSPLSLSLSLSSLCLETKLGVSIYQER